MEDSSKIIDDKYTEIITGLNPEDTEIEDIDIDLSDTEDNDIETSISVEVETDENFDEVLQLTQYQDNSLVSVDNNYVVAEYEEIKTAEIDKKHQIAAKNFVGKITSFILNFNDVELSVAHVKYIKQVGTLQLQHLQDLLYLVDVNKQMLNNIISRVNVTMAEDYAIINSYNNLANQHLKLMKELQTTYRAIPNVLKKMRTDVMCNQELEGNGDGEQDIMDSSQTNNGKQLNQLLKQRKLDKLKEQENSHNTSNSS